MHPLDPFGFGQPGFRKHARRFDPADLARDLRGLVVAITGANSGLGLAATRALAARGATVWMLCRDLQKAEAARADLTGDTRLARLDVASRASIDALDIPTPDVLVHNAGQLASHHDVVEGLERTVATHVVGPWRLGHRVRAATTVWVSSGGMYTQRLDVARLLPAVGAPAPGRFDGVATYAHAKRAQVVLARRLGQHAMHPGWADSPGVAASLPRFHRLTRSILRTPEQGADTIVWLAVTRPPTPAFWFDRAVAPEHVFPWTKHDPAEEDALLARLLAGPAG
ncbi:MAG: SDR family NAD(P)-dependent oxidoreductase [Pseudomonadota bacterium]|nr:SDR family NAD(P)-dependent oxidoreductase [Pseudomonadota bacterium]